MPVRGSRGPSEAKLSARQREWLEHLRAAESAGGTIKAYASAHGLSVQSLYQAGKRLRRRGVLEPRVKRRPAAPAGSFVKVMAAAARREAGAACRLRLPSGVVFECNTPLAHGELLSLLKTLAHPR